MSADARNPALDPFETLVGGWDLVIDWPGDPPMKITGSMRVEWLDGERWLIVHSDAEHPDFPTGHSLIGWDEDSGKLLMHYFDSRGVARVYETSLTERVWRISRAGEDQDFDQRFSATLNEDGDGLAAAWERGEDGAWIHDFDVTYTRRAD
jgi:hypothetical protein